MVCTFTLSIIINAILRFSTKRNTEKCNKGKNKNIKSSSGPLAVLYSGMSDLQRKFYSIKKQKDTIV